VGSHPISVLANGQSGGPIIAVGSHPISVLANGQSGGPIIAVRMHEVNRFIESTYSFL